ncbi:MAG: 16S rRNA (guanine(527)-N(7))-methyltransferase RsmG [Clostridia bacterium]|nr:16S rRNA (guanine(527)-N(7))-methyltransferase RsmG [Clostridia bacterium]
MKNYDALADRLIEANKRLNLTAITQKDAVMVLHIEDSLTLCDYIPQGAKVIDVGTGGGFPALPIAMARDDIFVTALDSTAKKLAFVEQTADEFSLPLKTLCARAEEAAEQLRETFDVAVSRGVTALPALCELCLPFVKIGGKFIAMKAKDCEAEISSAKNALSVLGGEIKEVLCPTLSDGTVHTLIIIEKISATPLKYPRRWSEIKKKPL